MEWSISKSPSYSILKVRLNPGETVSSEAGALVLMRGRLRIKTHTAASDRLS